MITTTFMLNVQRGVQLHFNIVAEENSRTYWDEQEQRHRKVHWWDGVATLAHAMDPAAKRAGEPHILTPEDVRGIEGYRYVEIAESKAWEAWVRQTVREAREARIARKEALAA